MRIDYETLRTQLDGGYRDVFSKAYHYSVSLNPDNEYLDEKLTDLYDLLFTAQTEERPVEKIIGKKPDNFVKEYFSDFNLAHRIKSVFAMVYRMMFVSLVLEILNIAAHYGETGLMDIQSQDLKFFLFIPGGIIINLLISLIASKVALKTTKKTEAAWSMTVLGVFITGIFGFTKLFPLINFDYSISSAVSAIISLAVIIVYNAVNIIYRYKKYGTVKNIQREIYRDSYYKNLQNQDLVKTQLTVWKKRYAVLIRKNKTTDEKFIDEVQKAASGVKSLDVFLIAFFGVLVTGDSISKVMHGESVMDAVIYLFFAFLVGGVIIRFFHNIYMTNYAFNKNLVTRCRASGMNMPEFIDAELAKFTE